MDVRVETLFPEIRVKYMPGIEGADWLKIHCLARNENNGNPWEVEYNYSIMIPDGEDNPTAMDYWVADDLSPWHQTFPAEALERIVQQTALRWINGIVKTPKFTRGCELWVIVEPDNYDLED